MMVIYPQWYEAGDSCRRGLGIRLKSISKYDANGDYGKRYYDQWTRH